jgi:dsDNA-binding SOS-regulon protein
MPLYKLLKKSDMFVLTEEVQQALDSLKALLTLAPVLVAPEQHEPLLFHLAVTTHVVSAALMVEREEPGLELKVQ